MMRRREILRLAAAAPVAASSLWASSRCDAVTCGLATATVIPRPIAAGESRAPVAFDEPALEDELKRARIAGEIGDRAFELDVRRRRTIARRRPHVRQLAERAAQLGEYLVEQLSEIPSPHVKEVRGKGLLIGVELKPEAGGARRFCEALKQKGILAKETHENVVRFAPPLVIDKETIDWALPSIREVLNMT